VELPLVPALLAADVRYRSAAVWADGDGDVWLSVQLVNACKERREVLFHSTPVKTVCRLDPAKNEIRRGEVVEILNRPWSDRCEAIAPEEVFSTWRCPKDHPSRAD
jgi:hypothetical protein